MPLFVTRPLGEWVDIVYIVYLCFSCYLFSYSVLPFGEYISLSKLLMPSLSPSSY